MTEPLRVATDVGGTFTDLVAFSRSDNGIRITTEKTDTTPPNGETGFEVGVLTERKLCDTTQALSLQGLLEFVDPERKIQDATPQALGRWINNDMALDFLEPLTDSWFDDSQETRKVIATAKTRRSTEIGIWKYLETRRDLWAKRFLQTAAMLKDADRPREWQTLTASAYGLMNKRPLKRIPLMEDIVELTIEAAYDAIW